MSDAIISVEELSKSFGKHEVLRKIDFNVAPGEIICIVGSSGSGKSTIAKLIAGFWDVTEGNITLGGKDIKRDPSGSAESGDRLCFPG